MNTWTARSLALALLLVGLAACGGEAEAPDSATPAQSYSVRGQVVTLPADNGGELRLAHEAIDDFMSADGEVVGMDSMTMSFAVAPGATPADLTVGDFVHFTLEVDWTSDSLATVTKVETLPEDTQLDFGAAQTDNS